MAGAADYAGDLTPAEAAEFLKAHPDALVVDVRTPAEWKTVGVPQPEGGSGQPIFLEWLSPPAMAPNPAFAADLVEQLQQRGATAATPLLFLCRSGARSAAAAEAVAAMGYGNCHNIVGGFEGSPGRGLLGWKDTGLPWALG